MLSHQNNRRQLQTSTRKKTRHRTCWNILSDLIKLKPLSQQLAAQLTWADKPTHFILIIQISADGIGQTTESLSIKMYTSHKLNKTVWELKTYHGHFLLSFAFMEAVIRLPALCFSIIRHKERGLHQVPVYRNSRLLFHIRQAQHTEWLQMTCTELLCRSPVQASCLKQEMANKRVGVHVDPILHNPCLSQLCFLSP